MTDALITIAPELEALRAALTENGHPLPPDAMTSVRAHDLTIVLEAIARLATNAPQTLDLKPAFDWYLKATGDDGEDYLNQGGWDDLDALVGDIGTALGIAEDGDDIPRVVPMLSACEWKERETLGHYVTACGKVWHSEDGDSPENTSNNFCFNCGGRIRDTTTEAEHEALEAQTYPKDET